MQLFHFSFYVPIDHAETVKQAVFAAGAGRIGNYDAACWQTEGRGQFRPLAGANPFIGSTGVIEQVAELKVETICEHKDIPAIARALIDSHPYEEPAYFFLPLYDITGFKQ